LNVQSDRLGSPETHCREFDPMTSIFLLAAGLGKDFPLSGIVFTAVLEFYGLIEMPRAAS
jgi:hypothetical protein